MPDAAPHPELLHSLGHLVRGLSALFWGLPLAFFLCVQTARMDWLNTLTIFPPLASTGLLFFGLWQLGHFQKQERPWRRSLDRAKIFGLINFGLSPFLYWWNRIPESIFYSAIVGLLALSALLFLICLNSTLRQLGRMLPDETLRHETGQFTLLNRILLLMLLFFTAVCVYLFRFSDLPAQFTPAIWTWIFRGSIALSILLGLLPLAVTMALIWKTKEVILDSVFSAKISH